MSTWAWKVTARWGGWAGVLAACFFLAVANGGWLGDSATVTQVADSATAVIAVALVTGRWLGARALRRVNPDPQVTVGQLVKVLPETYRSADAATLAEQAPLVTMRWSSCRRRRVTGLQAMAASPARSSGTLAGTAVQISAQLRSGYRYLSPDRRLLIIGGPGSGKSTMARLLCLGLLAEASASGPDPIPVLVKLSNWHGERDLRAWIADTVANQLIDVDRGHLRSLVDAGRLLPVFDGLDELPERMRADAVQAVNDSFAGRPVVVTCRRAEYEELIVVQDRELRLSTTLTLEPLDQAHTFAYLDQRDLPHRQSWQDIAQAMTAQPDGAMSIALSTPLMVRLAVDAYAQADDPRELLTHQFGSPEEVVDHLLDTSIRSAYRTRNQRPFRLFRPRWTADQAHRWLSFLAAHAQTHHETEIRWWQLSARLLPTWFAAVVFAILGVGLPVALPFLQEVQTGMDLNILVVVFAGVIAGIWHLNQGPMPRAFGVSRQRLRNSLRLRSFLPTLVAVTITLIWSATLIRTTSSVWSVAETLEVAAAGGVCLAGSVVLTLVVGVHRALAGAPNDPPPPEDPRTLLRRNRRAVFLSAPLVAIVTAALMVPAMSFIPSTCRWLMEALTGWPGWPGSAHLPDHDGSGWETALGGYFPARTLTVLPACLMALLTIQEHPWARFGLVRIILGLRRRLPFRVMTFLDDATQRGLLRPSGHAYAFRHRALMDRLARDVRSRHGASPLTGQQARRRRRLAVALAAAVVATPVALALPRDGARQVLAIPRLLPGIFTPGDVIMVPGGV